MNQRRYGRYSRRSLIDKKVNVSISKEDYLSAVYYISYILKDEKEVPAHTLNFICELIEKFNLQDKAQKLISETLNDFQSTDVMQTIPEKQLSEDDVFDDTSIPFVYKIDKQINRNYGLSKSLPELHLGFLRCNLASKTPIFSNLIDNIFLLNEETGRPSSSTIKALHSVRRVKFLIDTVGLSKEEALLLLVHFRFRVINELTRISRDMDVYPDSIIPELLGMSSFKYRKLCRPDQKLSSYGFIDEDNILSPDLIDCILDNSMEPYFADFLKPLDCSSAYDESTFSVPLDTTKVMENLLINQDSSSILLYGKPGSGKTEYSKTISKASGCKVYIYKNENDIESGMKAVARLNCYLSIKQKNTIIIVDEADKLLQTVSYSLFGPAPTSTKGTVNQMLENNKNKIIWIINHKNQIDESTRRRFTMSYKFDAMPIEMLRSITKSKIGPLNLNKELEDSIINLLEKFSVTGASVNNIVKTIDALKYEDNETLLKSVKTVLAENSKLLDNNSKKIRDTVSKSYNPDVINASVSPDKIVNMVNNAIKFNEKNKSSDNGIRMLFYGVSGSGKTELVRYIAQKLNKKILLKRASDIMSKYVGDNEQNIKAAFEEAEEDGKILLFDEADSFFADRENANTGWERTLTNEFLTQIEEFSGIVICTTNLKTIMDPAMERRFQIMVEFKALTKPGIKALLSSYFADYNFNDSQIDKLVKTNSVTPGDFSSLSSRIRFMDSDCITNEYIVNELYKLQRDKKFNDRRDGVIGFTAG